MSQQSNTGSSNKRAFQSFALVISSLCCLCSVILYAEAPGLASFVEQQSTISLEGPSINNTDESSNLPAAPRLMSATLLAESFSQLTNTWSTKVARLTQHYLTPFHKPSIRRPFVFFHVRKAGGTSWRTKLVRQGGISKEEAWVPCYRNAACRSYVPPSDKKYAVYAGHLFYADFENRYNFVRLKRGQPNNPIRLSLPNDDNSNGNANGAGNTNQFDCMIQMRPTIDRVVSCWNYRFVQEFGFDRLASNLTPADWDHLLPHSYSKYLEGCNNENVRVLGNIADEVAVNTLTSYNSSSSSSSSSSATDTDADVGGVDAVDAAILEKELERIYARMSRCVILLNGHDDTNAAILQHYIPWVKTEANSGSPGVHNKGLFKAQNLTAGSHDIIMKHNVMDEAIYQFAVKLSMEQYRVARLALNNNGTAAAAARR